MRGTKVVKIAATLALVSIIITSCSPANRKLATDIAYQFDPVAGAGMEVFDLLATVFETLPKDQLGTQNNYIPCGYSIREIKGWQQISKPSNVKPIPTAAETLWYQSGDAYLQVTCVPKSVSLEQWGQGTLNNLPNSFNDYSLLGQGSFSFQATPAHWIAYSGKPKGYDILTRGYMVLVDRGSTGLIISIAAPADQYDKYAPTFRVAIDSIKLN
jgi:hypothetical protein